MNQSISQSTQPAEHDDEGGTLDLVSYLDIIFDHRWLIISIALIVSLFGTAYALIAVPIYRSNILVQVEDSASSSKNILGDLSGMFDMKTAASAEIEVLRSRFIVSRAVNNAHLYIDVKPEYFPVLGAWIARRNHQVSVPGLFGFGGYVWGSEQADVTVFNVPVELENQGFELTVESNNTFHLTSAQGTLNAVGQVGVMLTVAVPGGEIKLLVSQLVGRPGARFRLQRAALIDTVETLQKALIIAERGKQSGIIGVELEGTDPKKVANILNELGREYVRQNVERKSEEAEKSLTFLSNQLPNLRRDLEQSEAKYTELRNQRGTVDLGEEAKSVLQHSVLAQTRMVELKQKRDELLIRFQVANPLVQAVSQQIQTVNDELETINQKIKKLPSTEQDVFRLTRDVKVNTDLYTALLNSAQQLRLVKASKVGNARLLDTAVVSSKPVRPNRVLIIVVALFVGLILGLIATFIRKILFGGLDDPHAIEQKLGLTVSATIPHSTVQDMLYLRVQAKSQLMSVLVHDTPSDPAVESLRSLRTSLQFSMLDAKNNIVMIAGATPGIGKSFVSVNFAAVLAMSGKKVLLIDADLRKGYLQRYFGLERTSGLSEVILGQFNLAQVTHKTAIENVDFIATGELPLRPAELLGHRNFSEMLATVSKQYDIVLIDTAPILAVTDALVVASYAGVIFNVVRGGVSTMGEIEEAVKRLRQMGCDITGVIFNDLKTRTGQYGYGSRYGKYRYAQYKY